MHDTCCNNWLVHNIVDWCGLNMVYWCSMNIVNMCSMNIVYWYSLNIIYWCSRNTVYRRSLSAHISLCAAFWQQKTCQLQIIADLTFLPLQYTGLGKSGSIVYETRLQDAAIFVKPFQVICDRFWLFNICLSQDKRPSL